MRMLHKWHELLGAAVLAASLPLATAQAKPMSITYVSGQIGNPFFTSVACGAKMEAEKLGLKFSLQGGEQYSPTSQTPVLKAVIAQHPDGILISAMVGQAMVAPLTQAKDAGIKIVFVDTEAAEPSLGLSYVSSNNVDGGKLAADKLAELIHEKGVVMQENDIPGISSTDDRDKGFKEEIAKYPHIKYVGIQYSQGEPAKATSQISSMIAAHPDLNGIFAVSTQEVEGAAAALQAAGTKNITVVGFDTAPSILTDIKQGIIAGVVVQEPLRMGAVAVDQLVKGLKNEATTPRIYTPLVFLTKETMKDPDVAQYIYETSCH